MKELFDIHVVLSTAEDFEQFEEEAQDVSEQFNDMLHYLYSRVDDDIDTEALARLFQHVWEYWSQEPQFNEIEVDELFDWVDQLLATWEDDDSTDEHIIQ
ncbi:hypothetical protein [Bowmanella sp. JS7-9]|uniref:Uncharacterized protein n=1 Tax=Pseudobowmanella zhangzhouensis TaxID=1537679 RepID=A0ABW1XKQ0_9ALTE|nr:hypothetical protein [Bowmanella sp. JS7-9]TBX26067.1 hypothetical protein TK45_02390 [Bowmanella sp. JS7-9]